MKAKMSIFNLFTQEVNEDKDPPMTLKPANDIPIETRGTQYITVINNKPVRKILRFPIVGILPQTEHPYVLDLGYNIRILCDEEYLNALVLAIHKRERI